MYYHDTRWQYTGNTKRLHLSTAAKRAELLHSQSGRGRHPGRGVRHAVSHHPLTGGVVDIRRDRVQRLLNI